MFEIKEKDLAGRLGVLITPRGKIQTPLLMPVVNPNRLTLSIESLVHCGTEMIITNAYILFKTLKDDALSKGVHKLLDFNGPIMTDSGAFQLMIYGDIDVTNAEISRFQERIGVDFAVPLDLPQARGSEESVEEALNETIERARENISIRQSETTRWVGPVQGGPYPALVVKGAEVMSSLPFDIHALGSVVPLMEAYDFSTVVKMILAAKDHLPLSRPLHLFGAGHPLFFSLAVLCGVDLFDSAAYALYAKSGRYITPYGTLHLDSMNYFPCSCEACLRSSPREILSIEKKEQQEFLALHNLLVSFQEIRTIQQAIIDGRLLDLVHSRAVTHPQLLKAFHLALKYDNYTYFEEQEPSTKRKALFIVNDLLSSQPFITRIKKRLIERFYPWGSVLRVIATNDLFPEELEEQVTVFSAIFGLVPSELLKTYPFYQNVVGIVNKSAAIKSAEEFLRVHASYFDEVIIDPNLDLLEPKTGLKMKKKTLEPIIKPSKDYIIFRAMVDFQFGRNAASTIQKPKREFSHKTKVLRRFVDEDGNLLATVRAQDFFLIPSILMAQKLHQSLKYPLMRVVVAEDAEPFLKEGRDAFSKFILDVDPGIRAGDEVLVVNISDELLATGKAVLCAKEMLIFNSGIAVKTRRGIEKG